MMGKDLIVLSDLENLWKTTDGKKDSVLLQYCLLWRKGFVDNFIFFTSFFYDVSTWMEIVVR